jgi:NlpC/P60 family putative phage cell wall peptidase
MVTREQIIAEALTWEGTPWHHRAWVKQRGCDCVGLLIGISRACGLIPADWQCPSYSPEFHLHRREELLQATVEALGCLHVALDAAQPGDFVLMHYQKSCSHAALLLPEQQILHAYLGAQRVLRERLHPALFRRVRFAYSLPGVMP